MKRVLVAAIFLAMLRPAVIVAQKKSNMFRIEDKNLHVGISAGWVAKEWTTSIKGRTLHEDLWGNPDKFLHGMQFGLNVQQSVLQGLGYRVGLYYEWYISTSGYIKDLGFDRFNEHSLYIPLHIMFRMSPFKNFSIIPHAGFGFNWAIYGNLKSGPMRGAGNSAPYDGGNIAGYIIYSVADAIVNSNGRREFPYETFDYNNHSPHHWNVQAEVGLALRFKMVELSFTYAWGLNRHWLYDDVPSKQNKMAANLALVF